MSNVTRSWSHLFNTGQDASYNNFSYFSNNDYGISLFGGKGVKDDRLGDPKQLQFLCQNDPLVYGIFTRISDVITSSGYEVFEVTKKGLKLTRPAMEYTKLLEQAGIKEHINNFLIASYSSGLGNALMYRVKNKGKIEYKVDPFIMNGTHRVEIDFDTNNNQIELYRILNNTGSTLYEFKPKEVYHYKHSNPDGNFGFGTNGILVASKTLQLKYNIMTFNSTHFGNNLQSVRMFGLDYALMEKMGYSTSSLDNMLATLEEELKQATGLRNANKTMLLKYPIQDLTKEPQTNSQTRSVELIQRVIQKELCHAMGVDENIYNVGDAKYDNAEKLQDQLYQQTKPTQNKMQNAVESYLLPTIDNDYNNSRFVFRFKRQFSQEEIDLKKVKNEETKLYFNNLKTFNEAFSDLKLKAFPTEAKLKELEELQQMTIKQIDKEDVKIAPASELQISDTFTQVTNAESVNRNLDFWTGVEERLDKAFKQVV